ncbi:hypothetical protein NTGM5_150093 [Candidatus Nitrotoga sp. M5]|nr:hypothetical protein NTGM5_150093 [Candidatus Nitrotoga sp. M5]
MGVAQVVWHVVRVLQLGNGGGEMGLTRQQDGLGAGGQVGLVLFDEQRYEEGVPAEGVGVRKVSAHPHADCANPDPVQARGDKRHVPKGGRRRGRNFGRR